MEIKEMIARLEYLDNKLWTCMITKEEDEERKRLRAKLQTEMSASRIEETDVDRREKADRQTDTGGHRLTFREAVSLAGEQIGLAMFDRRHENYGLIHDMCRVMAEVYMMSPTAEISVGGETLQAGLVAEVYREITPEIAETLAAELRYQMASVRCVKAYLRSALYIKVFEFEACETRLEEQVKRDTWCR